MKIAVYRLLFLAALIGLWWLASTQVAQQISILNGVCERVDITASGILCFHAIQVFPICTNDAFTVQHNNVVFAGTDRNVHRCT